MAVNTTLELVESYVNLLIMQYLNKPKASGTISAWASAGVLPQPSVQTISFLPVPTSGTWKISYNEEETGTLQWDDEAADIQTALRLLTGLSAVTVTGSTTLGFTVSFTGVSAPAALLEVTSSTLFNGTTVTVTIAETDQTLPNAVQNGFNFQVGTSIAQGAQLDVIGKYQSVTRTGLGFANQAVITLNDTDFESLIRMAIIKNSSGSSLATIMQYLFESFPYQIFVFDHKDMTMTYVISQAVGSGDLIQLFVTEGLLPVPMAVGVRVIYPPSAALFSFRTYEHENTAGRPFNTYADYHLDWSWLSYHYIVS